MNLDSAARRLCWHGLLLFLFGLLNGAAVQLFANPRMGLSAHLAGVQNGMVLVLFGLIWSRLGLPPWAIRLAHQLALFSMYAIWAALALAAIFGTSQATPIAGAGHAGSAWQEGIVTILLYLGSGAIIAATVLALVGLRPRPAPSSLE